MFAWSTAILLILGTWFLLALLLIGTGGLLRRSFGVQGMDWDDAFLCFWSGFALLLAFLQFWHLFLPVNWKATAVFAAAGLAGIVANRKSLLDLLQRSKTGNAIFLLLGFLLTVWMANRALLAPEEYDAGRYHLPVIQWSAAYPVVRGIGNIDGHFAFNNASLLYEAMLEVGFWRGRSTHVGPGILVLAVALFCLARVFRILNRRAGVNPAQFTEDIFLAVLLTPCVALGAWIAFPTTDTPTDLIEFVIGWLVFRSLLRPEPDVGSENNESFRVLTGTLLCAISACVKLSAAAYSGCAWMILVGIWLTRRRIPGARRRKIAAIACVGTIGIAVVWMTASVLVSGYPLYPATVFPQPVSWRMPRPLVESQSWYIRAFARGAKSPWLDEVPDTGLGYLPIWIRNELRPAPAVDLLPLLVSAIAGIGWLVCRLAGRRSWMKERGLSAALPWVPVAVGVGAWLFTAPALRFGQGFLWVMAALIGAAFAAAMAGSLRARWILLISIILIPLSVVFRDRETSRGGGVLRAVLSALWVPAGPDHGFYPVRQSSLTLVTLPGGAALYVPKTRGCGLDCLLWNGPLPGSVTPPDSLAWIKSKSAYIIPASEDFPWTSPKCAELVALSRENQPRDVNQLAMRFQLNPSELAELSQDGHLTVMQLAMHFELSPAVVRQGQARCPQK